MTKPAMDSWKSLLYFCVRSRGRYGFSFVVSRHMLVKFRLIEKGDGKIRIGGGSSCCVYRIDDVWCYQYQQFGLALVDVSRPEQLAKNGYIADPRNFIQ